MRALRVTYPYAACFRNKKPELALFHGTLPSPGRVCMCACGHAETMRRLWIFETWASLCSSVKGEEKEKWTVSHFSYDPRMCLHKINLSGVRLWKKLYLNVYTLKRKWERESFREWSLSWKISNLSQHFATHSLCNDNTHPQPDVQSASPPPRPHYCRCLECCGVQRAPVWLK